jgi:phage gp29-like protein
MPARKFWVYTSGADHDDQIYGLGLAHFLYWPVYFKRNGVRIWLNTLEAAARGAPYGTYPPGAPKHEQNKLLRALSILRDGGSAIWPEGMDVGTLDIDRSGAPSNAELHDKMNAAISKIVLSQTLTTDAEAGGGLGGSQAEVQESVAEKVQKADAMLLTGSFRRGQPNHEAPLEWLIEWNFPEASVPKVHYNFEESEDLSRAAERDKNLSDAGWVRTSESMDEKYPGEYERKAETDRQRVAAAELAEGEKETALPAPTAVADAVQDSADEELAGMVEEVRSLLKEVGSLQEFSRRLIELYPELSNEQLTEVLGNGMLSAHALGRAQIQEEARGVSQEES